MAAKSRQDFIYEGLSPDDVAEFEANSHVKFAPMVETVEEAPVVEAEKPVETGENQPQQPADGQVQPPAQQEQKTVDIRALQEARAEARAARQRAQELEQERVRIDERLKVINEALTGGKQDTPKAPTLDEDPLGYFQHTLAEQNKTIEALQGHLNQQKTVQDQEQQWQTVIDRAGYAIDQSRATNPDVDEALNFASNALKQEIANNLAAQGYQGAQFAAAFKQVYTNSIRQLANQCPQDPNLAAEHVRRNARYWGWQGPQVQQQAPQATQQQPVAQIPPVQQATPQQRAEQQQRHLSLSTTQGGQPPLQLNAKALADMSDEEFFKLKKSIDGRAKIDSIKAGN